MRRLTMILFLLVILLPLNISTVAAQFFEAGVQKLKPPTAAPDFTLNKLGGGKISLKQMRGKVIVINFFTSWCEVCQKESSSLEELAEGVKDKRIVFLLVAVKNKEKDLREFKKKFRIVSPILIDKNGSVAKAYGVFGHHEAFFINREGKILGKSFGGSNWTSENMKNLIQYLLAEKK